MGVTFRQVSTTQGRLWRARQVLLFLLLLIVTEDAVDLINPGAFGWAGDEYAVHGQRVQSQRPPARPTRIVASEICNAGHTAVLLRQPAEADTAGHRRDSVPSSTRIPRARSHVASSPEDASAPPP
jgi:hypothetical protein